MSINAGKLLHDNVGVFNDFSQVYLFGSALISCQPGDIDILLVHPGSSLERIAEHHDEIDAQLSPSFQGVPIHFTTLSESELTETAFLRRITYFRIKPQC